MMLGRRSSRIALADLPRWDRLAASRSTGENPQFLGENPLSSRGQHPTDVSNAKSVPTLPLKGPLDSCPNPIHGGKTPIDASAGGAV
jgi:hypothetical protein